MKKGIILVVVEFENDPQRVVGRAIRVAKILSCDLNILFCEPSYSTLVGGLDVSSSSEAIRQHILDAQREFAKELALPAQDAGLAVTTKLLIDQPVLDGILDSAFEIKPRIVIKGTQFHNIAERSLLIDTDWRLMRDCSFPLWLVKSKSFEESPVIVAAVDPTHANDKPAALDHSIVDTAKIIAESTNGDLHLIHTYETLTDVAYAVRGSVLPTNLDINEFEERVRLRHLDALNSLASETEIDKSHTHQFPGRPRDILPVFVRSKGVDLVVMGALDRRRMKRAVIGSTAERTLDHLPCDVLIVRDNEHQIGL